MVLIPPFENFSDKKSLTYYEVPIRGGDGEGTVRIQVDAYSHAPRTGLEEILADHIGPSFKLIERQRLDQMLAEGEFADKSMMVDEDSAFRLGKVLGANTVVLGSIRSIEQERKQFKGYGVDTENIVVTGKINIRAIELETMEILRSRTFEAEVTYRGSNFGRQESSDVARDVIDAVMEKVAEDEEFIQSIVGSASDAAAEKVEIEIASTPPGADVMIEGEYVGNTPLKIALPVGEALEITLSLSGYEEWTRKMKPRDGMSVAPTLTEE